MRPRRALGALGVALLLGLPAGRGAAQDALICIDPGHGGSDPGAVGNGLEEADLNLTAGLAFRDWLEADTADGAGGGSWDVIMTRDTDTTVSLSARCDYANAQGADYFLSIHANAGGGNGTETYAYASGTEADDLAHRVQEEVLDHLGTYDRGVKYNSFYVLIHTAMPADLNEMAFVDVWEDNAELLADPANLDEVGLAHLNAIQRHLGMGAYTPQDVEPGDPTGTVEIVDFPTALEPGELFAVEVAYGTDLYQFGQVGELGLSMQDAGDWSVLDEQIWDNGGAGLQGPDGSHVFDLTAPADDGEVFFVAWLAPLGGDWDQRYDDDSTLGTPTPVGDGPGDPDGPTVAITDVPTGVRPGQPFEVAVTYLADPGASAPGILILEVVEAHRGAIVETVEVSELVTDGPGDHTFDLAYDGEDTQIWFRLCLAPVGGDSTDCLAEDDTEGDPTAVAQPDGGQGCGSCAADGGPSAGRVAALLVGVGALLLVGVRRRRSTPLLLALVLLAGAGCREPPPAPEGLDETMRYLLREFHGDDAVFAAGLTGLRNWYDDEGVDLLELAAGEGATIDNADSFSLEDLSWDDIDHLPVPDDGRDLSLANGIVALALIDCHWAEAESLLVRPDQGNVFGEEFFESFERTFLTSRAEYESSASSGAWTPVDDDQAVYEDGYDAADVEGALLLTENDIEVDFLGIDLSYRQDAHFRHGEFDVLDEPQIAHVSFTYLPERAEGADGVNSLEQTYSVSVLLDWEGGRTLRVYALWSYIDTPWMENDSPAMAATAVNSATDAAQRLSDVCAGVVEIPEEP